LLFDLGGTQGCQNAKCAHVDMKNERERQRGRERERKREREKERWVAGG
jgi:hypothetical protein